MDIFSMIADLAAEGRPCALATVVQATGSAPQRAGAKMIIMPDGTSRGTVGGGRIEAAVIREARLAIEDGTPRMIPFDLSGTDEGLVCGGDMVVFVEPVLPAPRVVIIGAGHVGLALARIAGFAGFGVTVSDDRPEYADRSRFPETVTVRANPVTDPLRDIPVDGRSFIVVATRGHEHDLEAVAAALKTPAAWIGLVGSRRKRGVIDTSLAGLGFSPGDRERVIIPAGIPIGSVTPEEIAISIMAQIIALRRNHGRGTGNPARCGSLAADGMSQAAPAVR